jgi:predicted ester cyclase
MIARTIWAWSASTNEWQREFNLTTVMEQLTETEAQQRADGFAGMLNRDRKLHLSDWQGVVKLEETGIATIPGYISHTGG